MREAVVKRAPKTHWKEAFIEIEWLLAGGVSPWMILEVMNLKPENVERACWRYKKPYAALFDPKRFI